MSLRLGEAASDRLATSGTATLAGTLHVSLFEAAAPTAANEFEVISAVGGVKGAFHDTVLPPLVGGMAWQISYGPNNVLLRVVEDAAGSAGDYNGNGLVEQGDLDLVLLHWGEDATTLPEGWLNDFPSRSVDQVELDRVLLNWGTASAATHAFSAVSEPVSGLLWLLAACVAAIMAAKRRKSATQTEDDADNPTGEEKGTLYFSVVARRDGRMGACRVLLRHPPGMSAITCSIGGAGGPKCFMRTRTMPSC